MDLPTCRYWRECLKERNLSTLWSTTEYGTGRMSEEKEMMMALPLSAGKRKKIPKSPKRIAGGGRETGGRCGTSFRCRQPFSYDAMPFTTRATTGFFEGTVESAC
jgi:hypothetical protein